MAVAHPQSTLSLADQARRIAKRKLGSSPNKLPRKKGQRHQGILVHSFDCRRYGQNGNPQLKNCTCHGYVSQEQADAFVDAEAARPLKVPQKNGSFYRTRRVIVMMIEEEAVCQLSEQREAERAIKKKARKKEREETLVPSDAVRLLSKFLQAQFSKGKISAHCSSLDARTVLTLLNTPSELAESKLHELQPGFVSELGYPVKMQESLKSFEGEKVWYTAFDRVCQYAISFATGQSIGDKMFMAEADQGVGEIVLTGGRKDSDALSKILAHDNHGRGRYNAAIRAASYLGKSKAAEVFKQGVLQIGHGENRVRPQGAGPNSLTAREDSYEDNGD